MPNSDNTERPSLRGGEAQPNAFQFLSEHGPLPNPVGHTFPLLTHDEAGTWELVGTGFYVNSRGLFVTAGHVIEHVLRDNRQVCPLVILQLGTEHSLFGGDGFHLRPIGECWLGDIADVALGMAATATNRHTGRVLQHWCWPISGSRPAVGDSVATYAFPNHRILRTERKLHLSFQPDAYPGVVEECGDYRDSAVVPYPFSHVTCRIHGGASGGPVVGRDGAVVGVNCRYMEPHGPGVVAQIRCLQDSYLDQVVLQNETSPRRVTFAELIRAGGVHASAFEVGSVPYQQGRLIRLDEVLPSAQPPDLSIWIHG
jgi:hypothetical protein